MLVDFHQITVFAYNYLPLKFTSLVLNLCLWQDYSLTTSGTCVVIFVFRRSDAHSLH